MEKSISNWIVLTRSNIRLVKKDLVDEVELTSLSGGIFPPLPSHEGGGGGCIDHPLLNFAN